MWLGVCMPVADEIVSGADALKKDRVARMLVDVKGRVEAMMLLREKGIGALITCLDGILPPLVAAGAKPAIALTDLQVLVFVNFCMPACSLGGWFFAGYCLTQ